MQNINSSVTWNDSGAYDGGYDYEENLFLEYAIDLIITAISLLANFLIIFVILKSSSLRTKRNLIILNWAISDIIFLLSFPSAYMLFSRVDIRAFCIFFEHDVIFMTTTCFFVFLLSVNKIYDSISRHYVTKIIIGAWIIFGLSLITMILLCLFDMLIANYRMFHVYATLFVIIIFSISGLFELVKVIFGTSGKLTLRHALVAIFSLSWLPSVFISFYPHDLGFLFYPGFLNAFINLILLIKYDQKFKSHFMSLFKGNPTIDPDTENM